MTIQMKYKDKSPTKLCVCVTLSRIKTRSTEKSLNDDNKCVVLCSEMNREKSNQDTIPAKSTTLETNIHLKIKNISIVEIRQRACFITVIIITQVNIAFLCFLYESNTNEL